jgi:glycosyltransferase involved in cell wall biosynthesis
MAKKLIILTSHGIREPASRIRGYYIAKSLSENGFDVRVLLNEKTEGNIVGKRLHLIKDCIDKIQVARKLDGETLIYIQRGICSFSPFSLIFSLSCKFFLRKKVIYDIDDGLFLVGSLRARAVNGLIKFSDAVVVGGHELYDYVKKHNEMIFMIPTCVDLKKYLCHPAPRNNYVRLGFIGSPTTTIYLNLCLKHLTKLAQSYDFELRVVSAGSSAEYQPYRPLFEKFEKNGVNLKLLPWSINNEFHHLQNVDIGLTSLPDGGWERYKCGFKVINYMAAGIPPVASKVGEHCYIIQDGFNGFLCKNDQEWTCKLEKLIEDETFRRNMGSNARETAEQRYSIEENARTLTRILSQLY